MITKKELREAVKKKRYEMLISDVNKKSNKISEYFLNSEIYKIENTQNFFLTQDGYVYIVYAYGNNDYTNEMDIIIF